MNTNDANPPDATSHTPPGPINGDADDDSRIDLPRLLAESEERLRAKRALSADDGAAGPQPVADDLPSDASTESDLHEQPTSATPKPPSESLWPLKMDFDTRTGLQWSSGRLHEWPSQKPAPNASRPFRWPWQALDD